MVEAAASTLPSPSLEFVQHATRELGWEERLTVYEMGASTGATGVDLYNFPRLVGVLFGTQWSRLLIEEAKPTLMWVDFKELVSWLRDVIGDAEFADAVEAAVVKEDGYRDQIDAVVPLCRERVGQYHAVLESLENDDR